MSRTSSLIWGLVIACSLPVAASAQVGMIREGGVTEAKNDLPVDVLALSYSPASKQFATLRVPARGQVEAPAGDATIISIEPLAIEVGRREMFRSCATAQVSAVDIRKTVEELKGVEFLESASAREKIEAASALARLDVEQKFDVQQTFRNDPMRNELLRQQERYAPEAERLLRQRLEAAQDVLTDVTALALAWSAVEREKLSILHEQYETFAPLVAQARLAAQIRGRELASYDATAVAWHNYSAAVARALDERAEKRDAPMARARVQKSCSGPSQGWDWMEMEGPDLDGVSVLIAQVSFDHGPTQVTLMRRLSKTTRWAGRMDWPSGSTTASVRVRWPGSTRWSATDGKILAERKSITASVDESRRAVSEIEKKMKDTNFRAIGGDTLRTAPVF